MTWRHTKTSKKASKRDKERTILGKKEGVNKEQP